MNNHLRLLLFISLLGSLALLTGCNNDCIMPGLADCADSSSGSAEDANPAGAEAEEVVADFGVTAPNGGESWEQSSTYTIKWGTGTVGGDVMIELRTGSGTSGSTTLEISGQTTNDGSYSWKIPDTVTTGTNYRIRVRTTTASADDDSNSAFSIVETASLNLTSSAFTAGGEIPEKYTCDGSEASPPLTISGVSSDAKELVLFMDDLDGTPTDTNTTTDWNHWVVSRIPVANNSFSDYSIPSGAVEGQNDEGDLDYLPICPPGEKGDRTKHNYQFTLYSVNKDLTNNSSTRAQMVTAMEGSVLQKKTLKGYFGS